MNAARHDAVLPDDRAPPPKAWYEIAVPDCEADMYHKALHIILLGTQ